MLSMFQFFFISITGKQSDRSMKREYADVGL